MIQMLLALVLILVAIAIFGGIFVSPAVLILLLLAAVLFYGDHRRAR